MEGTGRKPRGFGRRVVQAARPLVMGGALFVVATLWVLALSGADTIKATDLAGVFCFAYVAACGTWKTAPREANIVVRIAIVSIAALLTGCGGGALVRNPVLYGQLVPYPLQQPEYVAVVALAVLLSGIDFEAKIANHADIAAAGDAIAHALFIFTAARVAIETFGHEGVGVIAAIFAGFASASGGGMVRDMILDWIAGRFRGVFVTICAPYRWASLFGAVLVVTLILTLPAWAWAGAALSGLVVYMGRDLTLVRAG